MIDTAWRTGEDLNHLRGEPLQRRKSKFASRESHYDHGCAGPITIRPTEMIVHGLEPGELLTRMLKEEEGFDVSEPRRADGFVALRFPGVRERLNGRMTTDEIERMLRESIGKAVRVRMRTPKGHSGQYWRRKNATMRRVLVIG